MPWYRSITPEQWRVLIAAKLGWMLDAMDFVIYCGCSRPAENLLRLRRCDAGMLGTVTLATSAFGGLIFGVVAGRVGRSRALMGTRPPAHRNKALSIVQSGWAIAPRC
jgi:hypothetical protein